ncbi:MAG: hypothetical protein K2X03_31555 [Bryobacteraceae bacterium]|nr:hypothetical protein [Bryobacteraceae bacterium]
MMTCLRWMVWLCFVSAAAGQSLTNATLTGRYFFRHLLATTDAASNVTGARSALGEINFDGRGGYAISGQQNLGAAAASPLAANGTYSVQPNGFVSLSNPLQAGATMNARFGQGAVVGASTESTGVYDLFIAVEATPSAVLTGPYWAATLEITNGTAAQARAGFFALVPNAGAFANINVNGQGASLGARPLVQTVSGATYSLTANGSGTANFGAAAAGQILSGTKNIYLGAGGEVLLGGSTSAGAHDLFLAVRSAAGARPAGLYAAAGLRIENGRPAMFTGVANVLATGKAIWARRVRQSDGLIDFSGVNAYTVGTDGSGTMELNRLGLSASSFTGSGVSPADANNYELFFSIRLRAASGPGINPQGVFNAASYAPVTSPVSPGALTTLFGSGLTTTTAVASGFPFPRILGGTEVLVNNAPVPVYAVSPTQISFLIPFAASGPSVSIAVRNGATTSAAVDVPLAPTSPGIFTLDQSGLGAGAILKPDFRVVNATNPARRGETVLVFLTGLGAVSPAIGDGQAASSSVLSRVTGLVNVYIGGKRATVSFAGAAPGLAGLYQLNVVVPADAPLGTAAFAIETGNAFHDMADLAIAP